MPDQVVVRPSAYYDSVVLMAVSRDVAAHAAVTAAAVVMGTPVNLGLLERQGFSLPSPQPGPNDLVLALRAEDGDGLGAAITLVDERLSARSAGGQVLENRPRSTRAAVGRRQELSLALVSVPGPSAAYEVGEALAAGLHVFCFSGGISLADEALLKQRALESGLLLLGPSAGRPSSTASASALRTPSLRVPSASSALPAPGSRRSPAFSISPASACRRRSVSAAGT